MDRNCSGIVEKDTEKTSRKLEVSLFCFGKEMVNLHLDPVGKKKVFDHLIEIGKVISVRILTAALVHLRNLSMRFQR